MRNVCRSGTLRERVASASDNPTANINSQQPTVNSQQSTVNSQQSTVNSQQSTANSQQSRLNIFNMVDFWY
ncbi:MAG: hypothetical protein KME64_09705 [Scytonematopsis contorta HA4267-MV1]|nr:hypothetical protein [Scytonematopsis contorta HA4267-MV1]